MPRAGLWLDQRLGEFTLENGLKVGTSGAELRQDLRAIETLRGFLTSSAMLPFFDGPWVPIFLVALTLLHPLIGAVGVTAVVALFLVAVMQAVLTERLHRESIEHRERTGQWWGLATSNAPLAGALGLASGVAGRWSRSNRKQNAGIYSIAKRTSFIKSLGRTVRIGSQIAVYGLGAWLVINDQVTPGVLVASAILLARALAPLEHLIGAIKPAMAAWRAYQRLKALPDAFDQPRVSDGEPTEEGVQGAIKLQDVTVHLPGRKVAALRGLSLDVEGGQCIGIVGPNGSGKSALAGVIAGAVLPSSGTADLGGLPIHRWQRGSNPPIGYMADDPLLVEGTVHENIVRFADHSLMTAAHAALAAGVHEQLQELPKGYETEVGPGGKALSLSERRAVALARTLGGKPRFVVLDEPESGVDGAARRTLVHSLEALKADGVTIVLVTHDPNLLVMMDRVVVMAGGAIAKETTPAEMLKKSLDTVSPPQDASKTSAQPAARPVAVVAPSGVSAAALLPSSAPAVGGQA